MRINGTDHAVPEAWAEATLLEFLRDHLGLTGTKFGCGIGQCGACTVHLNGQAARACTLPVEALGDAEVHTIEGLADGDTLHPVQQAWLELAVPQCGWCQAGQMMGAAALLARNPAPDAAAISATMDGHLCRCGTYPRIHAAVARAAELAHDATARPVIDREARP